MTNTDRARASGSDEFRKFAINRTPLGRIGEPDDIAKAAVFLASDESDWIIGEVVVASGAYDFSSCHRHKVPCIGSLGSFLLKSFRAQEDFRTAT
jgi:hypothetical protein